MVTLSSLYTYVYKVFLVFTVLINIVGILILKLFISKEKSLSYDITFPIMLIITCSILLIIFVNLANVSFDKKDKVLHVKTFKGKFLVKRDNIIKVERIFILLCKITYEEKEIKKSIVFLPSLREFFPLIDFRNRIESLLLKN